MNQTIERPLEIPPAGFIAQPETEPGHARSAVPPSAEPRPILITTRPVGNVVEVEIGGQTHCYVMHVRPPAGALLLVMVEPTAKHTALVWAMSIQRHRYVSSAQLIMQIARVQNERGEGVALHVRSAS